MTEIEVVENKVFMLIKYNFSDYTFVRNRIINIYSKCRDLEDSIKVFNWMSQRNSVSWNSLIASFVLCGLAPRHYKCIITKVVFDKHEYFVLHNLNLCHVSYT